MTLPARIPNAFSVPVRLNPGLHSTDEEFGQLCRDPGITFNPRELGFIPRKTWAAGKMSFGDLVSNFFQKKNHSTALFSHKLYNALKITTDDSFYFEYVGVEWITDDILKIDKTSFARLLGIKTINGSLFHQQGNFPSHGFLELSDVEATQRLTEADLMGIDYETVRLLIHQPGVFTKHCTEDAIARCKWAGLLRRRSNIH
jgi:hypothetical protein